MHRSPITTSGSNAAPTAPPGVGSPPGLSNPAALGGGPLAGRNPIQGGMRRATALPTQMAPNLAPLNRSRRASAENLAAKSPLPALTEGTMHSPASTLSSLADHISPSKVDTLSDGPYDVEEDHDHAAALDILASIGDWEENDDGRDPLDSARPELAVHMGRIALEALLRNFTIVVSAKIFGAFGADDGSLGADSAAVVKPNETEAEKLKRLKDEERKKAAADRAAAAFAKQAAAMREAERIKAMKFRPKELSPLLVLERQRAMERERRKEETRALRRAKQMEKERVSEARERQLMAAEEWHGERVKWAKNWGGREGAWKTVRVFISSTFTDMHGERDSLTRSVFPTLNNLCKSRHVRVVPVDLRWGLTAEDTSDTGLGALEHCLLEVDHSRPFFVVLHGDRYGWIPPNYRVSDREEFQWIKTFEPEHSITDMEIQYGFLRKPFTPVHAFCYRRDPSFLKDIPPTAPERRIFAFDYEGNDAVRARCDKLRKDMEEHPFCKTRSYTCDYGGKDDEGKPHVTSLAQFEQHVLDDLWEAIKFEFPPPPPPPSDLEYERSFHSHFVDDRSRGFIGRQSLLNELFRFADEEARTDSMPLIIVGTPGTGKTSLVTAFAKRFMEVRPSVFTIVHVVSASPSSTDIRETLLRICRELVDRFNMMEWDEEELDEYQAVKEAFFSTLIKAGEIAKRKAMQILLIIDAINQLSEYNGAWSLDWLPTYMPPGVRAIITSTPDSEPMSALAKRDPRPPQIEVPALSHAERQEIVRQQLAEYRKKLTTMQLRLLLEKKESAKPLFLLTACEELRLQAQYGMEGKGVDEKIRDLPGEIPALLDVVLERVERDLAAWAKTSAAQALLPEVSLEGADDAPTAASTNPDDDTPRPVKKNRRGSQKEDDEDDHHPFVERIFNDDATDPDLIGRQIVKKALTLIECSRHGLQESELLELLAPRGKTMLPPIVWARLYRSLELYLHPLGEEENGMLGFFSQQMVHAVRKRYLQNNRLKEAEVCERLAAYFMARADPSGDGMFAGESKRYIEDLVYYHIRALKIDSIRKILGSLIFIERRAMRGAGQMEKLLRDYYMTQEEMRNLKLSWLKAIMTKNDFNKFSRAALLAWIGEYMVFVGSHHTQLTSYPRLTFQYALNQPDISGPHAEAVTLMQSTLNKVVDRMDRRERKAIDRAEAAIWALLCHQYQNVLNNATQTLFAQTLSPISVGTLTPLASQSNQPPTPVNSIGRASMLQPIGITLPSRTASAGARVSKATLPSLADSPSATQLVPPPTSKVISDPAKWIKMCAKEFGAPKQHQHHTIAQFMSDPTFNPQPHNSSTGELSPDHAATGMAMETLVNVLSKTLSSSLESELKELDPQALKPAAIIRSVVYMTKAEADELGVSWRTLKFIRAALAEDLLTLSLGVPIDAVPRRYVEWLNKPQRNRIVADFAGLHSQVTCLALSPDATMIALGFKSSYIHLIDAGTGEVIRELTTNGHMEGVTCLSFSGDGLRLASGSHDNQIIIWDALTGTRLSGFSAHTGSVTAVLWLDAAEGGAPVGGGPQPSAAGKKVRRRMNRTLVSTSMEGDVRISAEKHRTLRSYDTGEIQEMKYDQVWHKDFMASPVLALAHNGQTDTLVGAHGDGDITVWDAHAPNLGLIDLYKFKAHKFSSVMCVDFSPDGVLLASGGSDGVLRIWRRHVVGADLVWKEESTTYGEKQVGGHSSQITAVHFSPDGTKILTCSLDKKLLLWDVESGTEILSMSGHADAVYTCNFLGEENRVVSASYDKTVKLWDIGGVDDKRNSAPVKRARAGNVRTIGKNGKIEESSPDASMSSLTNIADASKLRRGGYGRRRFGMRYALAMENEANPHAPAGAHSDRVLAATVSRDGLTAVTGAADKEIKVWDVLKGEEKCVLLGHTAAVTAVCMTHDQKWLFSGDADGKLMIWDGQTFDHIYTLAAHPSAITAITYTIVTDLPSLSVASRGTIVFTGSGDGHISAWNAETGSSWEIQPEVDYVAHHQAAVRSLQFVAPLPSASPPSCRPAPIDSGVFAEAYDVIKQLEKQPRRKQSSLDNEAVAAIMSSELEESLPRTSSLGRGRGRLGSRASMSSVSTAATLRGRRLGPLLRTGSAMQVSSTSEPPPPTPRTSKPAPEAVVNPYRADRGARRPDPAVTVEGCAPAHVRPRLVSISVDGKLVVIDLFTSQVLHEDRTAPELGQLSATAISQDGTRVAIATGMPAAPKPVFVSPGTNLHKADHAVLELPGHNTQSKQSKKLKKDSDTQDPGDVKKRAEEKLKAELARLEARKKRKEERRAAKKAEREKVKAAAAAARVAAAKAARRGSSSSVPEVSPEEEDDEEEEEDDDDDTEEEEAAKPAESKEEAKEEEVKQEVINDKTVSSLALSCDGTLLAAGCAERLLSIIDASRPSKGPLAQFLTLGEVTAVAVGPGLLPWAETAGAVDIDKASGKEIITLSGEEPATGKDTPATDTKSGDSSGEESEEREDGAEVSGHASADEKDNKKSKKSKSKSLDTWDALRFHASPVGDGNGHLGVIMAGDSTGAVFILRVVDVLRVAEVERQRKAVEQEKKRLAEVEARKRHEDELRRAADEERKRLESLEAAARPPVETLEFPTGVIAPAVLPPRAMYSDQKADRELAVEILRIFGVDVDELGPEEVPQDDAELMLQLVGMAAQPIVLPDVSPQDKPAAVSPATTTAGTAPAPAAAPQAGGKPKSALSPAPRRGKGGKTTPAVPAVEIPVVPETVVTSIINPEEEQRAIKLAELQRALWTRPKTLIGVFGGAGGLHDLLVPNLRRLVKRGAVQAAVSSGGMILDGGTAAGVMDMIGTAVASAVPQSMRILGVCPAQLVLKPGDKSSDPNSSPLEPHHTNFVLVPSNEWGGETSTMFTFAAVLSERLPCVSVLANGGMISKKEILNAVRHKIPVVVIEGSGRLADQIARAMHRREETPPEEFDPSIYIPDPDVREIVMNGEIKLFNVTGQGEALCVLLLDMLAAQRDRLLLDAAAAPSALHINISPAE